MRPLFTLVAALLLGSAAFGDTLEGRVTDTGGHGLPAVSVVTNLPAVGTMTDTTGRYQLQLRSGPGGETVTRVTFSSVGYQTRQFRAADVPPVVKLAERYYRGTDILVRSERAAQGESSVPFTNFSREQIERDYNVGEFPLLLKTTPNLFAYTDGGTPLGYAYTSIRGFDDKRITTYINGVPLNDPEDHATYFTDLPDFGANIDDIQVQRGVGNSIYGDASFGGTINVATNALSGRRGAKTTFGYGEYTHGGESVGGIAKQSVEYSSGLIDGQWHFTGRFSKQRTDGYRENSWYNGWAYALSLSRLDENMTTELYIYGGPMQMHLAYYGATREAITANRLGNVLTYGNETDNFNQPHYHLHNNWQISDRVTLANTLYYIRGKGYYEQYETGSTFSEYNIDPGMIDLDSVGQPYTTGNLVRQQWVYKNQYGWNPTLTISHTRGAHTLGGSFYYFESDHWGQVVWGEHLTSTVDPRHRYYQYFGKKWVGSVYAQEHYRLTDRLSAQATAQLRFQRYSFDQVKMGAFLGLDYDLDWVFFSPRLGANYALSEKINLFANVAVSSRTPTDASIYDANDPNILPSLKIKSVNADSTVYEFGDPLMKNERVYDFELGANYRTDRVSGEINLFWMDFRNEIIPQGGLNPNTGLEITVNADRSVHAGVELSATVRPVSALTVDGNFAWNYDRVKKYKPELDGYPVDFADKKIAGFPDYLSNLVVDYSKSGWRFTHRLSLVGRRYMELQNIDSLSLDPYATGSVSASYTFKSVLSLGALTVEGRIDNWADKKYETLGYGGNYAYEDGGQVVVEGWAEYYVAPERSFYGQIVMEMF